MRAVFTQNFFSPQPVEIGSTTRPTVLTAPSIRYDEQRYGSVDAIMRHADFAAFKQHFIGLIDEVNAFARVHADQVTPPVTEPRLKAIARDLDTFKRHLFDAEQDFFSDQKYLVYGAGFDAFEQLSHLLKSERMTLQRQLDAIINLAPDTTVCAGGCVTGLHNALGTLKTSSRGIVASAHRFKQQLVENVALNHSRDHHRYQPGNEVHYANAYINFSADKLGIAPRPDPFARTAEGEMTLELLNDFEKSVHQSLQPITMVQAMADDYAGRISHVAQSDASDRILEDIAGTIPIEEIAAAQQRIEALQTTTLDADYGPISLHDLLIESPNGENYQIVKPPPLVAVRMMDRLKKEKIIDYDPVVLAKAVDGEADLLYLDGLMWLNRKTQHEALDLARLCCVMPQDMLAALSRTGTLDPQNHRTIFFDIAGEVMLFSRDAPRAPLPDGWLKNFAGVWSELSGRQHHHLGIRLLELSLRYDDGGAIDALLDAGLDKDTVAPNGFSITALAAIRGCSNVLRTLLQHGVDIEAGLASGQSPLLTAVFTGQVISVKILLEADACVDAAADNGKTALMIAAQYGNATIAGLLLKAGANVNAATRKGDVALHHAAKRGHANVVQQLIDTGAHLDVKGTGDYTALMIAAEEGHTRVLLALLQAHAPLESCSNIDQHTALTLAALSGHLAAVRALLAAGAQVST